MASSLWKKSVVASHSLPVPQRVIDLSCVGLTAYLSLLKSHSLWSWSFVEAIWPLSFLAGFLWTSFSSALSEGTRLHAELRSRLSMRCSGLMIFFLLFSLAFLVIHNVIFLFTQPFSCQCFHCTSQQIRSFPWPVREMDCSEHGCFLVHASL